MSQIPFNKFEGKGCKILLVQTGIHKHKTHQCVFAGETRVCEVPKVLQYTSFSFVVSYGENAEPPVIRSVAFHSSPWVTGVVCVLLSMINSRAQKCGVAACWGWCRAWQRQRSARRSFCGKIARKNKGENRAAEAAREAEISAFSGATDAVNTAEWGTKVVRSGLYIMPIISMSISRGAEGISTSGPTTVVLGRRQLYDTVFSAPVD